MQEQLDNISKFINDEMTRKQNQIDQQSETISELNRKIAECNVRSQIQAKELAEAQHINDGNKQLINKLLGDLSRLQQDIDWYKRTFETRSIPGVIKDKLAKLFSLKRKD